MIVVCDEKVKKDHNSIVEGNRNNGTTLLGAIPLLGYGGVPLDPILQPIL